MKAIIYHLKRITEIILLYLVDTLAFIQPTRDSKTVTIVKPDEIGDFILWTDSAKELKSLFPGRKIILIANHVWVDLAKRLPYWDQIIPFDPKRFIRNPFYRVRYLALTRRIGADITIHPVFTRMFLVGDAIVRVSGAGTRITFLGDLSNVNVYQRYISNFWYNRLIRISPGCISEIKRQAELTRAIGAVSFAPRAPRLPRSDHCAVQPSTSPSYYVVCPGTHRRQKQWPAKKFAALIDSIHAQFGFSAVMCGGVKELEIANEILRQSRTPIATMVGKTNLSHLANVICNSQFVIGNDTGAIHLASALGVPSVCILGGAHIGRFLPYDDDLRQAGTSPPACVHIPMECNGCDWNCRLTDDRSQPAPCVNRISVQSVLEKVTTIPISDRRL